jgi:hypothetical protein
MPTPILANPLSSEPQHQVISSYIKLYQVITSSHFLLLPKVAAEKENRADVP